MNNKKRFWALLLSATLILAAFSTVLVLRISGKDQPFTGKTAEYYDSLLASGFPKEYATSLTKLHLLHPTWVFAPLQITETNSDYTWKHVIEKETEKPNTNLIYASDTYSAYHHPSNRELYDAGFYQPSTQAVEYFMDPRNFLNEADIFQFYDLSQAEDSSDDALRAVLAGSFMETAILENGMTYAAYLEEIGKEIGIDPVFLAVKLRQEQGVAGSSPIISGSCGDTLLTYYREQTQQTEGGKPVNPPASGIKEEELLALNGYYNPFNIAAGGTGVFNIYRSAMIRAQEGSMQMSEKWGGSPAWDTLWKGIYGGALFIKNSYIDQYQSTIYLQKFNVDGNAGSNNFWKQYMQNLAGALSEGRSLYQSFAANDTLDAACRFLIPVYQSMPQSCPDPAKGNCKSLAAATDRYQTTAQLTLPDRQSETNDALFLSVSLNRNESLQFLGTFTHSYGVCGLEYSWDGKEWFSCSKDQDLQFDFSGNLPDYGEHILLIRGEASYSATDSNKKLNRYFLCAAVNVTVIPPPSVQLTLQSGNAISDQMYYQGTQVQLPICSDDNFAGWVGSDGSLLPSGGSLVLQEDIRYTALFLNLRLLKGASVSLADAPAHLRFYAVLPETEALALDTLAEGSVTFGGLLYQNQVMQPALVEACGVIHASSGQSYRQLALRTPDLGTDELSLQFSADFSVTLAYPDGSSKTIPAIGAPTKRSAAEVASAALQEAFLYSPKAQEALRLLLTKT